MFVHVAVDTSYQNRNWRCVIAQRHYAEVKTFMSKQAEKQKTTRWSEQWKPSENTSKVRQKCTIILWDGKDFTRTKYGHPRYVGTLTITTTASRPVIAHGECSGFRKSLRSESSNWFCRRCGHVHKRRRNQSAGGNRKLARTRSERKQEKSIAN